MYPTPSSRIGCVEKAILVDGSYDTFPNGGYFGELAAAAIETAMGDIERIYVIDAPG